MERWLSYQVITEDLPASVGQILRRKLGMTSGQISAAKFRRPGITVNGQQARVTEGVSAGDRIRVCVEKAGDGSGHLVGASGPVDILYEDDDLAVVNKPAGTVVHPSHGHYKDTLANQLVEHYRQRGLKLCVRAVGRLDKDSSGAVLFAKNRVAAARLWEKKAVEKEYLALVQGQLTPKEGCVDLPVARADEELNRMRVCPGEKGAKEAVTYYRVMEEYRDASLVGLHLENGRTHQIRVHMAYLGHPLLGDGIYGKETDPVLKRAALHCHRMRIRQPFTGEIIGVEAPLPEDMVEWMKGQEKERETQRQMGECDSGRTVTV